MDYRKLSEINVSNLCFGTATFVAGRLFPKKKSQPGIDSLEYAIQNGINFIHSNSNLNTQWATRKVLNKERINKKIFNIIKIETPLNDDFSDLYEYFSEKIEISMHNLDLKRIFGIIYEIDIKKTNHKDRPRIKDFIIHNFLKVKRAFDKIKNEGKVDILICMTHNELEMKTALDFGCFDGYSAYFNLIDTWPLKYFDQIKRQSKSFIGIRPLKMGVLTNSFFNRYQIKNDRFIRHLTYLKKFLNGRSTLQDFSIRFSLAHPAVKSVIVGMSKKEHVNELINASMNPLSLKEFTEISTSLESN